MYVALMSELCLFNVCRFVVQHFTLLAAFKRPIGGYFKNLLPTRVVLLVLGLTTHQNRLTQQTSKTVGLYATFACNIYFRAIQCS